MVKILFVCLGNICRSPLAEGVVRYKLAQLDPPLEIDVDSAGTGSWHVGSRPDERALEAAARRGVDLGAQRARQVEHRDFHEFDRILAMDESNLNVLRSLCPAEHRHKLSLFLEFAPGSGRDVPDPYYGGSEGFDRVLNLIEAGAEGLIRQVWRDLESS